MYGYNKPVYQKKASEEAEERKKQTKSRLNSKEHTHTNFNICVCTQRAVAHFDFVMFDIWRN